ncbi:MAG: hypothetical protein IJE62_01285 [Clostridia bacterium]|nr:hypothetical protein [Clostridia bacterium]
MLLKEKRYDFKKELLTVHKKDRRDYALLPNENELVIPNGFIVVLPKACDKVVMTAAKDFQDYLFTSMGISAMLSYETHEKSPALTISLNQDIGEASGYMGYRVSVSDSGITLEGYDSRGVAQGLYFLEDLMNLRHAPYLEKKVTARKAMFTPRMVQSPFGMFEFSDECLSHIAHLGYDAIELWIKDFNLSLRDDFLDMTLICERAEKYGIKVYIELYAPHTKHPLDEGGQEFYDNLYGTIFKACPKICGLTILGEAIEFESRDPNVKSGERAAGWWPCIDYPEFVTAISQAVRKVKPDADIIFSTYNWGWAPKEDRLKLIEALPTDISLLVTWDMREMYKVRNSVEDVVDYTLSFVGPGSYFESEAIAAKKRGIRLYANSQTAGRTWDFGLIPYEPMPYQWIKRYERMIQARNEWNLAGLLETIHYGFHPSFISELEKWAFFTHEEDLADVLKALLKRDFGEGNIEALDKAMHLWSDAITHYVPTNDDQYGAFRIGPAFPLWLRDVRAYPDGGRLPDENKPMFGNTVYRGQYDIECDLDRSSMPGVRVVDEMKELEVMTSLFAEGISVLEEIKNPNDALLKLINLGKYMYHACITVMNCKKLYILKHKLAIAATREENAKLIDEIEALLLSERENVEQTIPIVQLDSRLGWEASMEYMGDESRLRWKLNQLDGEIKNTLRIYRTSNEL